MKRRRRWKESKCLLAYSIQLETSPLLFSFYFPIASLSPKIPLNPPFFKRGKFSWMRRQSWPHYPSLEKRGQGRFVDDFTKAPPSRRQYRLDKRDRAPRTLAPPEEWSLRSHPFRTLPRSTGTYRHAL